MHPNAPLSYTTIFSTGAAITNINKLPAANLTAIGISSCGHPTLAISGSKTVGIEKTPAHRVGDLGTNPGSYVATQGSQNTSSGG